MSDMFQEHFKIWHQDIILSDGMVNEWVIKF